MELQQFQLNYLLEDDRILFRLSFREADGSLQEIRSWLTRRLTVNLWHGIVKAMEMQVAMTRPAAAHASAEIVGMGMAESVTKIRESGGFDAPYQPAADTPEKLPLGAEPLLIVLANFTIDVRQPLRIDFKSRDKGGFEVAFTPPMLHGFCEVLKKVVATAEWGIALHPPGSVVDSSVPRVLN